MDFALHKTLVDATIGHPHVVTMGVREQVVKPATKFAGFFTMSLVAISFTPPRFSRLRRSVWGLVQATVMAGVFFGLQSSAAEAGTATAQFRVGARVVRSCRLSPQALLEQQSVKANVPVSVTCDNNATSRSGAPAPVRGTVSYTWVEGTEETQGTKLVTINY